MARVTQRRVVDSITGVGVLSVGWTMEDRRLFRGQEESLITGAAAGGRWYSAKRESPWVDGASANIR